MTRTISPTQPATPAGPPQQRQRRGVEELLQFRCSYRWLGASLGTGLLGALAAYRGGAPAVLTMGALGAAGAAYATVIEPRQPRLERVTFALPTLPPELDGLRIGQLSDMHLGLPHCAPNTRWAVQQMQAERPDLLVLTGDFVSRHSAVNDIGPLLRGLHAPLGVFAITGNHDYWEGVDRIRAQLDHLGYRLLLNENLRLDWRGAAFWLAGIDDMWYGSPNLTATLDAIPPDAFTLLLAHEPDFADVAAARGVDLQLSGHTHGGHVRLPLLGTMCLPAHGLRYVSGTKQVGTMQLYITRGLGGVPLRLNCPPEATLITLRCAA